MSDGYITKFKQNITLYLEQILKIDRTLVYQSEILYDDKELNLVYNDTITNIKYDEYLKLLYEHLDIILNHREEEKKIADDFINIRNEFNGYLKKICKIDKIPIKYEVRINKHQKYKEDVYYIYFCYDGYFYYKNSFDLFEKIRGNSNLVLIGETLYELRNIKKSDFDDILEYEKKMNDCTKKIKKSEEERKKIEYKFDYFGTLVFACNGFKQAFEDTKKRLNKHSKIQKKD
jgi:hypothetical protein